MKVFSKVKIKRLLKAFTSKTSIKVKSKVKSRKKRLFSLIPSFLALANYFTTLSAILFRRSPLITLITNDSIVHVTSLLTCFCNFIHT